MEGGTVPRRLTEPVQPRPARLKRATVERRYLIRAGSAPGKRVWVVDTLPSECAADLGRGRGWGGQTLALGGAGGAAAGREDVVCPELAARPNIDSIAPILVRL